MNDDPTLFELPQEQKESDPGPIDIWTDGGARGNPGPAGIGAVLKTSDGSDFDQLSRHIGSATNNVAEYMALIEALKLARSRGVSEVSVKLDSELVVKQLKGEYKVKHPGLRPLFEEASSLLRSFKYRISHVRREHNKEADALVNAALDELSGPGSLS